MVSLCVVFIALFVNNVSSAFRVQYTGIHVGHSGFYKAAVYEHSVIIPAKRAKSYDEAVQHMLINLNEYRKQADIAGSQDVDIIVFPEDGIYGTSFDEPSDLEPYLEYIPDPTVSNWTPCLDPEKFNRTKVQSFLSCLAMKNSLYLIANYGDIQPCPRVDPNCPKSGHYQYNTNIVFNRKGELIARYHKQNLFFENQFQDPVHPEMVYFDTDFGRFGTFTCFDILFHDPAIRLIKEFNVTDIVFPTAWMDALPFLSAIGYHSSFAAAYNVNFLAANIHHPLFRFQGSGIYTPDGALAYYYDRNSPEGRLMIRDVPVLSRKIMKLHKPEFIFGSKEIPNIKNRSFRATLFHDWYNFVSLTSTNDNITVCQDGLCCFLSYDRENDTDNYALGVFNGLHRYQGKYYLEVCILLQCAPTASQECGQPTSIANGYFNYFTIRGNFSTPYVTPQVVTSYKGSLELPPMNSLTYDENGLTGSAKTTPLLETSLVGRVYESD